MSEVKRFNVHPSDMYHPNTVWGPGLPGSKWCVLASDHDALKADNARLRGALVKYGEHGLYCPYMEGQCDCGLLEALGALWEVAK